MEYLHKIVKHKIKEEWGNGVVLFEDKDKVIIEFDEVGKKALDKSMASLKIIGDADTNQVDKIISFNQNKDRFVFLKGVPGKEKQFWESFFTNIDERKFARDNFPGRVHKSGFGLHISSQKLNKNRISLMQCYNSENGKGLVGTSSIHLNDIAPDEHFTNAEEQLIARCKNPEDGIKFYGMIREANIIDQNEIVSISQLIRNKSNTQIDELLNTLFDAIDILNG